MEIRVVPYGLVLNGVVNRVAAKQSVGRREILVHTNLPVVLPIGVMVPEFVNCQVVYGAIRIKGQWSLGEGCERQEGSSILAQCHRRGQTRKVRAIRHCNDITCVSMAPR